MHSPEVRTEPLRLGSDCYRRLATTVHAACGLVLGPGKEHFAEARLARRLAELGLASYEAYLDRLQLDAEDGELQVALDLLTTNETYFFREPAHFRALQAHWSGLQQRPLEVWSAACSYGDEAYSAAILLSELQVLGRVAPGWSVLGSDVSDRALRAAAAGVVPDERLRELPEYLKLRYLRQEPGLPEGHRRVEPGVRAHLRFARVNLLGRLDELGAFDTIFLRNVMIYFDARTRLQVLEQVVEHLRPGGLLLTGIGEGRIDSQLPLRQAGPGMWYR